MSMSESEKPNTRPWGWRSRDELRLIAEWQKVILLCLCLYVFLALAIILVLVSWRSPPELLLVFLVFTFLAVHVVSLFCTEILQSKLKDRDDYPKEDHYRLKFGALPPFGLIMLLWVNSKATETLRNHQVTVGYLGADMKEFKT